MFGVIYTIYNSAVMNKQFSDFRAILLLTSF